MIFTLEQRFVMIQDHSMNLRAITNPHIFSIQQCINSITPSTSQKGLVEVASVTVPYLNPLTTCHLKPISFIMLSDLNILIPQGLMKLKQSDKRQIY